MIVYFEAGLFDLLHESILSVTKSIVNVCNYRFFDFGEINNTNFALSKKLNTNLLFYVIILTN